MSVKDRESDVQEVLENYNNIERECLAAKQTVSAEIREKVLKLKEDWTYVRARGHDYTRDTELEQVLVTNTARASESESLQVRPSSESDSRKSSVDSQASGESSSFTCLCSSNKLIIINLARFIR